MKKQAENQPIDDLFARKLGSMSLQTSPDGFERLQARMSQGKPEARIVFWRNPAMQRYMAVAACLVLLCLFGWLYYWPSGSIATQVAKNQLNQSSPAHKPIQKQQVHSPNKSDSGELQPNQFVQEPIVGQLAEVAKSSKAGWEHNHLPNSPASLAKSAVKSIPTLTSEQPVFAQTQPATSNPKPDVITQTVVPPTNSSTAERLAENTVKSTPPAERVLVVTIAEPEALVAARQTKVVVEENPVVAVNEKFEKETKVGGLWKQVKRIKEGELFARHDNSGNDDRGLLGRAYNGLKQSFDKDKSAKQ